MNHEKNHDIEERINNLLETDELSRFRYDLLIDVFGIWDCYAQDWIPDSPLLLRFESDDALVRSCDGDGMFKADTIEGRHCVITFGPVDTFTPISPESWAVQGITVSSGGQANQEELQDGGEDPCLCWLRIEW